MFTHNQRIVCVDDKFPAWVYRIYQQLPVKGQIYTVRSLSPLGQSIDLESGHFQPDLVLYVHELHNPDDPNNTAHSIELGFRIERFAPLETIEEDVEEFAEATAE